MNYVASQRKQIEKQIENVLVAQAMMQDIPRGAIVKNLGCWRQDHYGEDGDVATQDLIQHKCGSAACFGGWVAVHPHFKKQGVKAEWTGAPKFAGGNYYSTFDVSKKLFGNEDMFVPNYSSISDQKVIERRLKDALDDLVERLEQLG